MRKNENNKFTSTAASRVVRFLRLSCSMAPAFLAPGLSQAGTVTTTVIPASYFGMISNTSTTSKFPNWLTFGLERYWDTPNTVWPEIEKTKGKYTWTSLDDMLKTDKSNGVDTAFFTMSRTPSFYASNTSDPLYSACNYGPGECEPPVDVNADGSGSDQTWINWVSAVATHVNGLDTKTYAHVGYWEPWNEVDRGNIVSNDADNPSYQGTYAQLVRMTEDAKCTITGKGTIHPNGFTGSTKGVPNSSGVPCASKAIDSTALIVMPSSHTRSAGEIAVSQNFLYCNVTGKNAAKSGAYCNTGTAGAAAIDILNEHIKPGRVSDDVEGETKTEYLGLYNVLRSTELSKPYWNGESGYASDWGTHDDDWKAAFVGRFYFIQWSLGIQSSSWYTWDIDNVLTPSGSKAAEAYNQLYSWMVGATMSTQCASVGTQWTCGFTRTSPKGYEAEAIWDTSKTCTGGTCGTNSVKVDDKWINYIDLTGKQTTISTSTHKVPVGLKPILLQN